MSADPQVEPADLDALADFIRESGEPQPLEELALRFIELVRQRVLAEPATP
jgi:hypothetical protein